jgi:hypothetical protein
MKSTNDLRFLLTAGDPFARLLLQRLHWPRWLLPAAMVAATSCMFALTLAPNAPPPRPEPLPLIIQAAIAYLVQPLLVAYWLWMPLGIWQMVHKLALNGAIVDGLENEWLRALVTKVADRTNGAATAIFSTVVAGLALVLVANTQASTSVVWRQGPYIVLWSAVETVNVLLTCYAVGQIFVRVLFVQWLLGKMYAALSIHVQPLHPDAAGGLSPVSELIISYVLWFFPCAIFVFASSASAYAELGSVPQYLLLQSVTLPIFTIAALALSFRSTRRAMQRQAAIELAKFSVMYNVVNARLAGNPTQPARDDLSLYTQIAEAHKVAQDTIPTWPFNTGGWRRLAVIVGASFTPLIIAILDRLLARWFGP